MTECEGGASGASGKTKVGPNMNKKEAMRMKNDLVINTFIILNNSN